MPWRRRIVLGVCGRAGRGYHPFMVSGFIAPLTGVRFIFAFMVVIYHIAIYTPWLTGVGPEWRGLIQAGPVAVNFFFILSGFILTLTYAGRVGADGRLGRAGTRDFYVARAARIYPVYLLGLAMTATAFAVPGMMQALPPGVVVPPEAGGMGWSLAASLAMVQAWVPAWAMSWNSPGWSLAAEAFFYALFPVILPLLLRCRARGAVAAVLVAYGCSWLIPLLLHMAGVIDLGVAAVLSNDDTSRFANFWPLLRLPEFVMGVAAGVLFLRRPGWLERSAPVLVWGGLGCVFAGIVAGWQVMPLQIMTNGGLGLPVVAVILGLACAGNGGLGRICGAAPMVLLGQASYALYILHLPLLLLVRDLISGVAAGGVAAAVYTGAAMALSVAVFLWLEKPCQRRLRGWLGRTEQG